MRNFIVIILSVFLLSLSNNALGQEIPSEKNAHYAFHLSALKHQHQIDAIVSAVQQMPHVQEATLTWEDYTMKVSVAEGGTKDAFDIDQFKMIVVANNAEIEKMKKTYSPKK